LMLGKGAPMRKREAAKKMAVGLLAVEARFVTKGRERSSRLLVLQNFVQHAGETVSTFQVV
jgi:hypothetical protein